MKAIIVAALCALLCAAVSGSLKVKKEHRTAFFGEDIHINIPSGRFSEVVFKSRSNPSSEVVLLQSGLVVNPRCYLNSLGHLVLDNVQEEDEGIYVIKNNNNPNMVEQLILNVRDCAVEEVVKYGETYHISLNHIQSPITLEFRPSLVQSNQTDIQHMTEPPAVVLYNQTEVTAEEYVGRLSVSEKRVALNSVRMTDEGSFTVLDRDGKVRRRNCLNVREHQNFIQLSYGETLKMKLYLHHSHVSVVYRSKSDTQDQAVLDQGVLVVPLLAQLEGRLTVEGAELIVKKVNMADTGVFKVTDLTGFAVAHVYVEVEAYKLPRLTVAILSMLSIIASMLLVCLLSCLYKVHKRNKKNKKLMLLAQQAGKGDGEAFRQVVHEAYTRFTEESLLQSVCDKPSESTEVTIKGLEVSKPGRYQALPSENFLEMSDSGVEFTSSGIPLDSDTDGAVTYASRKPLLNAISPTAVAAGVHSNSPDAPAGLDGDLSTTRTPDSVMSASPTSNPCSFPAATPDGSLRGSASPGMASRGTVGSESLKSAVEDAEKREAEQKEASGQST
ncbi:uncharacterized protein LOC117502473 [Thalassophryne amazonica]|uniref:uncharacterized protein LOC117502473 n=1 Tax=Thalassophryne amazonica TaxID=390379 RepID=UPI001471532E|nr:uncharacterized protein LOC117502473 [Thalassophryne amazonica]